jgi:hypothetical protein
MGNSKKEADGIHGVPNQIVGAMLKYDPRDNCYAGDDKF